MKMAFKVGITLIALFLTNLRLLLNSSEGLCIVSGFG